MKGPQIIQGGMGVGVSGWRLARSVSMLGQLGVVSGTGIDVVMVRRLNLGDEDGSVRRALASFPFAEIAEWIVDTYFVPEGKQSSERFHPVTMQTAALTQRRQQLIVAANFVEVFLAKEGHSHPVGINFLDKIKLPMMPALYGALLADVDYVLIGAGIPREIPKILDALINHRAASLKLPVEDAHAFETWDLSFDPWEVVSPHFLPELKRPFFLPIVGSATLAVSLAKKGAGKIDGFVVEGPRAGGHVVPPRGVLHLNQRGEPIYGAKDELDFAAMRALGLPFWLAGSYGSAEKLKQALALGASGIQVGTAFAFCEESGITDHIKESVLQQVMTGTVDVFTSPNASPAGLPFKIVELPGSVSEHEVYQRRPRVCDLGVLRRVYRKDNGSLGYRCPGEPVDDFLRKGGDANHTRGRRCLCNGLLATIGLGQTQRNGYVEPALVTAGDDLQHLVRFLPPGQTSYTAADVIERLIEHVA